MRQAVDRWLVRLATQGFLDFVKHGECQHLAHATKNKPGSLPGVVFVERFDLDPGIGLVPVVSLASDLTVDSPKQIPAH